MLEKCKEPIVKAIRDKIDSIYKITKAKSEFELNDLWDGYAGVYLFQKKFEQLNGYSIGAFDIDHLNQDKDNFGLGFAGQIWVDILNNPLQAEIYSEFIEYLEESSLIDAEHQHYNLVYGGLGKLICLIECNKHCPIDKEKFNALAKTFLKNAIEIENGKVWYNPIYPYQKHDKSEVNISMTQGIASMIMGLVILHPLVDHVVGEDIKKTLSKCVNWLKTIVLKETVGYKNFPTHFYSTEEQYIHFNRIGWAYGDISVAFAIYKASEIYQSEIDKNFAMDLLKLIATYDNEKLKLSSDASIGQGTSGLTQIFNRLYKETKIKEFDDARWYWLNETLNMARFDDGQAGYKFWVSKSEGFKENIGFYGGIAGVGLVLLGFLTEDLEIMDWDRCLLLN